MYLKFQIILKLTVRFTMETLVTSNKTDGEKSSRSSDHDHDESLHNITKTVLNYESTQQSESSGDNAILSTPEKDLWVS